MWLVILVLTSLVGSSSMRAPSPTRGLVGRWPLSRAPAFHLLRLGALVLASPPPSGVAGCCQLFPLPCAVLLAGAFVTHLLAPLVLACMPTFSLPRPLTLLFTTDVSPMMMAGFEALRAAVIMLSAMAGCTSTGQVQLDFRRAPYVCRAIAAWPAPFSPAPALLICAVPGSTTPAAAVTAIAMICCCSCSCQAAFSLLASWQQMFVLWRTCATAGNLPHQLES